MSRVVLVRHGRDPSDDHIVTYLARTGFEVDERYPFDGELLGEMPSDVVATVVYGGNYNAYDSEKHPFLRDEYRWIDQALVRGLPLLGICQGAQMIAHHLGAFAGEPSHGRCEFGYYETVAVEGAEDFLPRPHHFVQAHFHGFDLPDGAQHLARSEVFENQAFEVNERVFGFQFHPEQTRAGFARWQDRGFLYDRPGAQTRAVQDQLAATHDAAQEAWFMDFLSKWLPAQAES